MLSNHENSFSSSHSPVAKKKRKLWKSNPSERVPRSTYYRWQKKIRLSQVLNDNSSVEASEVDDSYNSELFKSYSLAISSSCSSTEDEFCECDTENNEDLNVRELEDDIDSSVHEGHNEVDELRDDSNSSDHYNHTEVGQIEHDIMSLNHDNYTENDEIENDSSIPDHDNHTECSGILNISTSNNEDNSEFSSLDDDREFSNLDDDINNLFYNDNEDDCNDDSDVESCRLVVDFITRLYDNSNISLTRSVLLILHFYVTQKLTKTSLQILLNILQEILPQPNRMPRTLHHIFKFVEKAAVSIRIVKHYYCKKCLCYIGTKIQVVVCASCSSTKGFSHFYEVDLINLLKYMFEKRSLWSKLRRSDQENDAISDITNGSEYLRVNSNRNEYDLTLIMNTDGLSLVKSSKSHCWPLMFMIAELPEHLRESFICIIGLWYDPDQKPSMNTFLQPFCEKIVQCFHEGITWIHPITKEKCTSKIVVPLFIADAPARAEIQNIMYFSGRYGCNICEMKTQCCRRIDGKRRTRAYIFRERPANLRNNARMERQALEAVNNNLGHSKGVKGLTVVSALPLLDLGTCVLPEYMHSVLLGVGNQFINLWINQNGNWNIKQWIPEIDEIFKKIRPPCFFNRMPRSLTFLQYYKASEFYNLILFYSLPIFVNYLPDIYFQHWILFVAAIFNLLERSIPVLKLEQSEILLKLFVRDIQNLYNDRQYTYNVHQLLHLVLCIKRWGPLWSTSAFPFENMNGILAKCVHGSKHLGEEMMKNLRIAQGVQYLKIACQQDQNISTHSTSSFQLLDKKKLSTKNLDLLEFVQSMDFIIGNVEFYLRATIDKDIFTSKNYKKTKTNSYTVKIDFTSNFMYGEIQIFMKIENKLYVILKPFTIEYTKMFCHHDTNTFIQHILPITEGNKFECIEWSDIKSIMHMIRVLNYICIPPNRLHTVM